MQYDEALSEAGLNKWESRTYVALLELGSTTTGPLIKKCEVPASKIYPVLESLNKKGLSSYVVKGKTKYFQAVGPEAINAIIQEKHKQVSAVIPNLKALQQFSKSRQSVEIFEGMSSITKMVVSLIDSAKSGDEWLSFSIGEDELTEKGQLFWNKIGIARYEKRLDVKIMDNKDYKSKLKIHYKDRWKYISKIIKFSNSIFPATTIIFRNRIIIINFLSDPETAVVIESKDLFKFYREFFLQQWKIARK